MYAYEKEISEVEFDAVERFRRVLCNIQHRHVEHHAWKTKAKAWLRRKEPTPFSIYCGMNFSRPSDWRSPVRFYFWFDLKDIKVRYSVSSSRADVDPLAVARFTPLYSLSVTLDGEAIYEMHTRNYTEELGFKNRQADIPINFYRFFPNARTESADLLDVLGDYLSTYFSVAEAAVPTFVDYVTRTRRERALI